MHAAPRAELRAAPQRAAPRMDRWLLLFAAAVALVVTGTVHGLVRTLAADPTDLPPAPPTSHAVPLALAPR